MCGSKGWAPAVECLLNYSGVTFTLSIGKAEQAFVMSHKPPNEWKRLWICFQVGQLQSASRWKTTTVFTDRRRADINQQKILLFGKRAEHCRGRVGVIQDIICRRLNHKKWGVVWSVAAVFRLPKAPTAWFLFLALAEVEAQDENKRHEKKIYW